MPYGKFLGLRYHYRETKASRGFWIFWFVFWIGLTGLSLVLGGISYVRGQAFLGETGYDGLISGLTMAGFFGCFWLIPLVNQIVKKLIRGGARRSAPPYASQNSGLNANQLQDAERYHAHQAAARVEDNLTSEHLPPSRSQTPANPEATLPPDQLQTLSQANHLMAKGQFAEAAPLFAKLAEVLVAANRLRRAANLHVQAAQAYAASANEAAALTQARAALTLFQKLGIGQQAPNFYTYFTRKLNNEGMHAAAETLAREFAAPFGSAPAPEPQPVLSRADPPARLPTQCPKCGAPIYSNQAHWIDASTAECDYCGALIRSDA